MALPDESWWIPYPPAACEWHCGSPTPPDTTESPLNNTRTASGKDASQKVLAPADTGSNPRISGSALLKTAATDSPLPLPHRSVSTAKKSRNASLEPPQMSSECHTWLRRQESLEKSGGMRGDLINQFLELRSNHCPDISEYVWRREWIWQKMNGTDTARYAEERVIMFFDGMPWDFRYWFLNTCLNFEARRHWATSRGRIITYRELVRLALEWEKRQNAVAS